MAEKRGNWNGKQIVLTAVLTEHYVEDEDDAPVRAVATVKDEDGTPLKGLPILIFYEDGPIGQPVPSSDKGEVKLWTPFLKWGSYKFTFKIGDALQVEEHISLRDRAHRPKEQKRGGQQSQTGQQQQPPRISTEDLQISGPAAQDDGSFLIGCALTLKEGGQGAKGKDGQGQNKAVASGARFQYFTGADPQGMRQLVEASGRAAASFKVRREKYGDKVTLYVKVWGSFEDETGGRLYEVRELPLPASPPKRRLWCTGVSKGSFQVSIALRLNDKDNNPVGGLLSAWYFHRDGDDMQSEEQWEMPASGRLNIILPRLWEPQEVIFVLDGDDKVKTSPPIRIPGLREEKSVSGTRHKSLADSFRKGYEGNRSTGKK